MVRDHIIVSRTHDGPRKKTSPYYYKPYFVMNTVFLRDISRLKSYARGVVYLTAVRRAVLNVDDLAQPRRSVCGSRLLTDCTP